MSEPFIPKDFQLRGMKLMAAQSSLGLFLDPGMGKTATWLGTFVTLQQLGLVDKMLVIVPIKPMYGTWPAEIDKYDEFNHLTWAFLHGDDKAWTLENAEADIYLINPEGIQWLVSKCDPSKLADVICIDESTKFKSSASKRFKSMRKIFPRFDRRWIGTGTPSPNGLEDLFSQIFVLDGGEALGQYVTHFRNKWFHTKPWNEYKWIPNDGAFDEITTAITPLVLQLTAKDYLDLPEVMVVDKIITLPPAVARLYKDIEEEYIADLPSGTELLAPTDAAAGVKCRQIANGAVYTDIDVRTKRHKYEVLHDEKLDVLDELLEEIGEHPILVVYEFQHDLHRITLRHNDWPCLTGMSGECLQFTLREFNAGNIARLLIQSSGAHGLNIQTGCHHMVMFGLTWNWEDYKQMIDRLYRQGQSSSIVYVYRVLAQATLDIEVAKRLELKREEEEAVKSEVSRKRDALDLG